jgi:plastocyanin
VRFAILLAAWFASCSAVSAAQLQVTVTDVRGIGIADVVVVASGTATPAKSENGHALMDQIDKNFVPEVLVVRVGTSVSFPNSDAVAHQVYSFSPAKRFALPLYRGRAYPPILFDQSGLVVLGCNIHDQMVGYIYVTTSPYFGKSDARGQITFNALPAGSYKVNAWHPRFDEEVREQELKVVDGDSTHLNFGLAKTMRPKARPTKERIRDY